MKSIKLMTFLLVMVYQSFAFSGESSDTKYTSTIVAFVNFDCPHCQKFSSYIPMLRSALHARGVDLFVSPLPTNKNHIIREQIYYVADSVDKALGEKVLMTFFKMSKEQIEIESLNSAIDWLSIENTDYKEWSNFSSKSVLNLSKVRLAKAIKLAKFSGVVESPSFVYVKNKDVVPIFLNSSKMSKKISEILDWVQQEKEKMHD